MSTCMKRRGVAALTTLCLTLSTGLLVLSTACASNDKSYDEPAPAISAFTTGTMSGTTFTATPVGTNCEISQGGSVWFRANFGVKGGSAIVTPGNIEVQNNVPFQVTNITQTTDYTLTVTSKDGKKATKVATVTVLSAPSGLTYSNEDATYYVGVQIPANTATVAGATPITYTVNPALPSGLNLSSSTGAITGTPATTSSAATYTVTATNAVGHTSKAIQIAVAATPITFSVSPATISSGASTTLTWDATSVAGLFSGVTITANPTDASLPSGFNLSGTANVSPAVTTTYTLSATPAAGGAPVTKTVDVTVGAAPVTLTSFTATPTAVVKGSISTLAWTFTGLPTILTLDGSSVLGSTSTTVTPLRRQTFTLHGENAMGGDTKTVAVGARALYHLAGSHSSGRGNVDGGVDENGYSTARFYRPNSITWDEKAADGSMIVCDYSNNLVRRIAADRTVTTIAGTPGLAGTDSTDPARSVKPRNSAVDPVTGDIYVGGEDYTPKRLLKLAPKGDGTYIPSVVTGFTYNVNAMVIDSARQMYFIPYGEAKLYKMDLTQAAPTASVLADVTAVGTAATAMAKDFNGGRRLLYVVGTQKILKIDIATEAAPVVSTLTGSGTSGFADNLTAASGTVNAPQGVAVDTAGNVYIADRGNYAVRMVPASGPLAGALITIAGKTGTAAEGYASSTTTLDGTATLPTSTTACLSNVYYVAAQGNGGAGTKIYVADAGASFDNQAIRVITVTEPESGKLAYTLDDATKPGYAHAGSPRLVGNADGVGTAARFTFGTSSGANLATLPDGSLTFAADTGNNAVRVITGAGLVSTLKDAASANFTFTGPKSVAVQVNPTTKALTALYVGDAAATKKIRKFTPNGDGTYAEDTAFAITAVSGGTFPASVDAQGLAVDSTGTGTLYVTDASLSRLFKVNLADGVASDFVATTPTKPVGVAVEYGSTGAAQAVWVAAYTGNQVVKYDMTGAVSLTIGTGTAGWVNGAKETAQFQSPTGIAVDGNGYAYVNNFHATQSNTQNGIRVINTTTGEVGTLFGYQSSTTAATGVGLKPGLYLGDAGATPAARSMNGGVIYAPQGLTVNALGDLTVSTPHSVYQVIAPANK